MARFEKGVSGNPNGRPKGRKQNALTNKEIQELLGKSDQHCLNILLKHVNGKDIKLANNTAKAMLDFSFRMRALNHKIEMDKRDLVPDGNGKTKPKAVASLASFRGKNK